jgi:hypothetical protein
MNAVLRRLGIDPVQWSALTRAYLTMDLRRAGGARLLRTTGREGAPRAVIGLLIGAFINSLLVALLVVVVNDPLTAAVQMVMMISLTVAMLLVVDFTGSVLSADDYWIVGPRPVESRTYFAARVSAVLAYVAAVSTVMSVVPGIAFAFGHDLGIFGLAGAVLAAVLASCTGASLAIGLCIFLMTRLHPSRLVPAISVVHLLGSAIPLAGYLVVMRGFEDAVLRDFSIGVYDWIWYIPATWYAAIVPLAGGVASTREAVAAAGAVLVTLVTIVFASSGLSLDSAARLAEATTATTRGRGGRRWLDSIPGFSRGEAYAVATLIGAQFRHDLRFRLAILGVIPLTVFYMLLGWESGLGSDPFGGQASRANAPIYMGIAFIPMVLHTAVQYSDGWRAAWVFWASPCDPGRLVLAAKNFVSVVFIGAYVVLLGTMWSFSFDRVWHAFVHAVILGGLAHLLLQSAVIMNPALPFTKEPKRGEQSSRIFGLLFVSIITTSMAPVVLPLIYRRAWSTVALIGVIAAASLALERLAHRRVAHAIGQMEWA